MINLLFVYLYTSRSVPRLSKARVTLLRLGSVRRCCAAALCPAVPCSAIYRAVLLSFPTTPQFLTNF